MRKANFNPRPPRGGRLLVVHMQGEDGVFQSTPPARGATSRHHESGQGKVISIHAPREGGDPGGECAEVFAIVISIHAPREGGDVRVINMKICG